MPSIALNAPVRRQSVWDKNWFLLKGHFPVYRDRTVLTAADLLNDKVLPFFDGHGIRVHRVLTDNDPELCGRQDSHPYELFLHLGAHPLPGLLGGPGTISKAVYEGLETGEAA